MKKLIVISLMLLFGVVSAKESSANDYWHRWWKPELSGKYTTDSTCRVGHAKNMSGLENEDWVVMYQTQYVDGETVRNQLQTWMNEHRAKKGLPAVTADETITLLKNGCTFRPITGLMRIAYSDNNKKVGFQQRSPHESVVEWGCYYEGELVYSMDCGQVAYDVTANPSQGTSFQSRDVDDRGNIYIYQYSYSTSTSTSATPSQPTSETNIPTVNYQQTPVPTVNYQQTPEVVYHGQQQFPVSSVYQVQEKWWVPIVKPLAVVGIAIGTVMLYNRISNQWVKPQPNVVYDNDYIPFQFQANQQWLPIGSGVSPSGGSGGSPQNPNNTWVTLR